MKKINKDEIYFLIRSYNEMKELPNVLMSIKKKWFNNIIIVDDWSKDWTWDFVEKKYPDIIYIKHFFNLGWGATLETWFEYIRRNRVSKNILYVVTFDADWQHNIEDIYNFIGEFEKSSDLDVVLWSRFIKKTNSNVPFFRKIILNLGKIFTFMISWVKLTDSHNGYRMFKAEIIEKINLTMNWMEYASEMIDIIYKENISFKEVPVNIKYTEYSMTKWQKSSNAINIAIKVIRNKFFK